MIARRLLVTGKVQGVFYRAWTERTARSLGLDGWVRNRTDGTVEIVAQGPDDVVEDLIRRCHEGPPAAAVDAIQIEDVDPQPLSGFGTLPTT